MSCFWYNCPSFKQHQQRTQKWSAFSKSPVHKGQFRVPPKQGSRKKKFREFFFHFLLYIISCAYSRSGQGIRGLVPKLRHFRSIRFGRYLVWRLVAENSLPRFIGLQRRQKVIRLQIICDQRWFWKDLESSEKEQTIFCQLLKNAMMARRKNCTMEPQEMPIQSPFPSIFRTKPSKSAVGIPTR